MLVLGIFVESFGTVLSINKISLIGKKSKIEMILIKALFLLVFFWIFSVLFFSGISLCEIDILMKYFESFFAFLDDSERSSVDRAARHSQQPVRQRESF